MACSGVLQTCFGLTWAINTQHQEPFGSVSKPIVAPVVHIKIAGINMDVHSPKNGIFIGIDS